MSLMNFIEDKSIIQRELEENEFCEIELKQGKLFLNKKDITNMRLELFKILKQSINSLKKTIDSQAKELEELFGEKILKSNNIKSIHNQITQHDCVNDESNSILMNNILTQSQTKRMIPLEKQEQSENKIFEMLNENILIQQYSSIILLDSIIENNQSLSLSPLQNQPQQQQQQEIIKTKELLSTNIEINQTNQNDDQKIRFESPLFNKSDNLYLQIFDLQISEKFEFIKYQKACKNCIEESFKPDKMNKYLKVIKKVFILDTLYATVSHLEKCFHIPGDESFRIYEINYTFENYSNLKYHKLDLDVIQCFKELEDDYVDEDKYINIKIILNNYLKQIQFHNYYLPYISLQQTQDKQYLSYLTLNGIGSFSDIKLSQINAFLNNIQLSELHIRLFRINSKNLFAEAHILNTFSFLVYIRPKWYQMKREHVQIVEVINKKYTNILYFFALNKLFKDQFSTFRLAYDLYDEIPQNYLLNDLNL